MRTAPVPEGHCGRRQRGRGDGEGEGRGRPADEAPGDEGDGEARDRAIHAVQDAAPVTPRRRRPAIDGSGGRPCLQSLILPRVLPIVLATLAAWGVAPPAGAAPEEPAPTAPAADRPRFVLEAGYATEEIVDGASVRTLVEGVLLRFEDFEVQARSVVIWGDAEGMRRALGEAGRPAAGPAAPDPAAGSGEPVPATPAERLKAVLGPVVHALYAEGDVQFRLGSRSTAMRCERLFADFRKGILTTGRVLLTSSVMLPRRGRAVPLAVRADRMRQVSERTFLLEDAAYTTCDFEDPHYRFRCTEFELSEFDDHTTFIAWNNVIDYAGVPFLFLPVLGGRSDLSARPLRSVNYTRSSRFGHEVELTWGDDIFSEGERWGEWRLRTDWRSRRGGAAGPELDYRTSDYEGSFAAYYARDKASTDQFDGSPVPRRDRGRVRWEHRQRLSDAWRLDLSLWDFSDRNFQREYLKREALRERDPENYVVLRFAEGTDLFSVTAARRLDRFTTHTETMPEVAARRIGAPVLRGRFPLGLLDDLTYTTDASGGVYERAYDEALGVSSRDQWRGDAVGRLEGVKGLGPVRISPFFTAGTTYHEGGDYPDGAEHRRRGDLALGVRAAVEARRDWGDVRSDLFDLRGMTHRVGLEALWYRRFAVSRSPAQYVPLDATETLDEIRATEVRLRQRWQTERGSERVDWIDLELRGLYFSGSRPTGASPLRFREEGLEGPRFADLVGEEKFRARPLRGPWGPYEGDLRVRLRENLFFLAEGEYDPYDRSFATAALGLRWFVVPRFSLYVGDRRIGSDSDIYTFRADWAVSDRWSLGFSQQADLRNSEGLETEIRIRRVLHDFVIELGLSRDRASNDRSIHISVIPAVLWDPPVSARNARRLDFEAQRWYR